MRVFSVDYGDARTGVAISDMTRTLVGDAWVLKSKNMRETARLIADEVKSRDVSCVVVGHPKNMDGSIGERAEKSEQLAGLLESIFNASPISKQEATVSEKHVEVVLWDERLTTKDAHRILSDAGKRGEKRKKVIDAVAASLILESYLASHNNTT